MKTIGLCIYTPTSIPTGVRWDVPPTNQGQIVEYAYATAEGDEAGEGAEFLRVTDTAAGEIRYYRHNAILEDSRTKTLAQLEDYDGDNIWEDVIYGLGYDEATTNRVDPSSRGDRFFTPDGLYYQYMLGAWHVTTPDLATYPHHLLKES